MREQNTLALGRTPGCRPVPSQDGNQVASVGISIDVPSLAEGVRFYADAFGFTKVA